jgi:hypothetical protein
MRFPQKIPGLSLGTILTAILGLIWISLEGGLIKTLLFAYCLTLVLIGHLVQRYLGGKRMAKWQGLALFAGLGLMIGLGGGLLTFLLMALKTGLHSHGPEFSPDEIEWFIRRVPLWTAVGLISGIGIGFVSAGFLKDE